MLGVATGFDTSPEKAIVARNRAGVQAIVGPKTGGYNNRFYTDIADNDTLHVRDIMVLTLRDGRLVDKKWLGKERK